MRRRPAAHHGLLLVDKPAGPTSHDLVQAVRRVLGQRQVGHTGTLDPPATGLLPLVLGRATRLARFLPQAPKRYVGTLRLGWRSDTDDASGSLERGPGTVPDTDAVLGATGSLVGTLDQLPPVVSAKQVDGRRLHELARAGVAVERRPSRVTVHRFELTPTDDPERFGYVAEVSAGTYVRSLARDLGERLGCGGLIETLRRTTIGPYTVDGAVAWPTSRVERPPEEAVVRAIVPLAELRLAMPAVRLLDENGARRILSGSSVADDRVEPDPARDGVDDAPGPLRRIAAASGELLGVGELVDGSLRPRVVVAAVDGGQPQTAENA